MFQFELHHGTASLLRRTLTPISTIEKFAYIRVLPAAVLFTFESFQLNLPASQSVVIDPQHSVRFSINLSRFVTHLAKVTDEEDAVLIVHGHPVHENFVGFQFTKPGTADVRSNMAMLVKFGKDQKIEETPAVDITGHARIEIPAQDFIWLMIRLQSFNDTVCICATKNEVEFSATNEEVVLKTQDKTVAITGIQDGQTVSFSFKLQILGVILNTCKLSENISLVHSPDDDPRLYVDVDHFGQVTLVLPA